MARNFCGRNSMKNRSIAQIILINFFKTIGVIVLLLGVGVLSYYLTMLFLKQTQRVERSTQYEHVIDVNPGIKQFKHHCVDFSALLVIAVN